MFKRYLILLLVMMFLLYAFPLITNSQDTPAAKWEYDYAVPIGFKGDTARPTIDTGVIINGDGVKADGVYIWDFLNSMGDNGWELVSINSDGSYIFKRQK